MSLERYGAPVFNVFEVGDIACSSCVNQDGYHKAGYCGVYPEGGKPRCVFDGEPCADFVPFTETSAPTR